MQRSYADVVRGTDIRGLTLKTYQTGPCPVIFYEDKDGILYDRYTLRVSSNQVFCMCCNNGWHYMYFPGHHVAEKSEFGGDLDVKFNVKDGILYYKPPV